MSGKKKVWKVYFRGNFWGRSGRQHAGEELVLEKQFSWGEENWYIPTAYLCGEGIVLDFCIAVAPERVRSFLQKWLAEGREEPHLNAEEREQMEQENPLQIDFRANLRRNGKLMRETQSCAVVWIPEGCLPEETAAERVAEELVEHYELDRTQGWVFHRVSFPWDTRKRPELQRVELNLEREPIRLQGPHFHSPGNGKPIVFRHPLTGTEYSLTVLSNESEKLCLPQAASERMEFPEYHTVVRYRLEPELSAQKFSLIDCRPADSPREIRMRERNERGGGTAEATAIALIGGADGPTAVFLAEPKCAQEHTAYSSLRFEPVDEVEWRIEFREKRMEDISVPLI